MSDLIDREQALQAIADRLEAERIYRQSSTVVPVPFVEAGLREAFEIIKALPSVLGGKKNDIL